MWSAHDEFQPRGFNRVTDAPLLRADFRVHTVTGHFVLRGTSEWETRIEAGMSVFEDGNRQLFAYAHRQIPLVSREGHWLAVRPNVYIDSFSDEVTGYASPSLSTSLGLSLHGVREWSGARLEAELNPNLLWVDNEWGPGGSGMLDLSIPVGHARVGGTLFGYLRGPEDYSLWRVMTRISLPVGGAGPR